MLHARTKLAAAVLCGAAGIAVGLTLAPSEADAGSRRCYERRDGQVACRRGTVDRRTQQEREWEHDRAVHYDPTGSYAAYPDWARYALSPKGQR